MSETLLASDFESSRDAIAALFHPLEDNNQLVIDDYDYPTTLTYDPPNDSRTSYYGEWRIDAFDTGYEPGEGGIVLYSERHTTPTNQHGVNDHHRLFVRSHRIASRLHHNDNLRACEHCGWLHNYDDDTRIIPYKLFSDYDWMETDDPNPHTTQCIGFESFFWPRLHVHTHDKRTNPIFDEDELDDCGSLVLARGMGPKTLDRRSDFSLWRLRNDIEENPDDIRDDIDRTTLETTLDYVRQDADRSDLVDRTH